jgi:hypothetical protein
VFESGGWSLENWVGQNSISPKAVQYSASGAQGEKPIVNQKKVCKGSRQNRSVPSEKGLALMIASEG